MRLTNSKEFEGKLVHAWTTPTFREVEHENAPSTYKPERFSYVVDENDVALATVTDQYSLVTNRDFVSAVDLIAEDIGLNVEAISGQYVNGRSYYKLKLPDLSLKVGTDPSITTGTVDIWNDYQGGGSLRILTGWFRLVCSNGMVVGEIASQATKRHTGVIDLDEFVRPALLKVQERFEVERIVAETLAKESIPDGLVQEIIDSASERYHADIQRAVRENRLEIGDNLWAVVQAVSEISTHRMQQRQNGLERTNFNASADTWATRNFNRVRELVGA